MRITRKIKDFNSKTLFNGTHWVTLITFGETRYHLFTGTANSMVSDLWSEKNDKWEKIRASNVYVEAHAMRFDGGAPRKKLKMIATLSWDEEVVEVARGGLRNKEFMNRESLFRIIRGFPLRRFAWYRELVVKHVPKLIRFFNWLEMRRLNFTFWRFKIRLYDSMNGIYRGGEKIPTEHYTPSPDFPGPMWKNSKAAPRRGIRRVSRSIS